MATCGHTHTVTTVATSQDTPTLGSYKAKHEVLPNINTETLSVYPTKYVESQVDRPASDAATIFGQSFHIHYKTSVSDC